MSSNRYSRRNVLKGLGATTALLPLLHSENAFAAEPPRRLLMVLMSNGMIREEYWPTGGDGRNLSSMKFGKVSASLDPYKKDLTFVRGLNARNFGDTPGKEMNCSHYSYTVLFSGKVGKVVVTSGNRRLFVTSTTPTIDQVIAEDIQKRVKLPIKSLHLGLLVTSGSPRHTAFFRAENSPLIPEIDPKKVLKNFFGEATTNPDFARMRAEKKSILDFVGKDLGRFSQNLGAEDRYGIEQHLQSIREIEKETDDLADNTCKGPTVPPDSITNPVNFPKLLNAQMDLVTAAFRCDLTRVATIQLTGSDGDPLRFEWLKFDTKPNTGYHGIAHEVIRNGDKYGNDGNAKKIVVDTWFTQQIAGLIQRLKAIPEGGGTMLDNTAVVFINHMGDGRIHDFRDLPMLIAGNCGGAIKTGLNLGSGTSLINTNALWVSIARAMGVNMTTFGDPKYGSGPVSGLLV